MKQFIILFTLCTTITNAQFFDWSKFASGGAAGGAGGPPTTATPAPCGLGLVPLDPTQNDTADAQPGQVAWQVSVMTKKMGAKWAHACGGALISKQAVLTSASCVDGLNAGFVRIEAGIVDLPKGGFVRRRRAAAAPTVSMVPKYPGQLTPGLSYTEKVVKHPDYNKATGENNLAVLRLATVLDFTKAEGLLNTVCYPSEPLAATKAEDGGNTEKLFTSGWGNLQDKGSLLRGKLQLKPIQVVECQVWRNDNEFCGVQTEGSGECEGDQGGPVFSAGNGGGAQLVGVTSRSSATCTEAQPTLYTEVFPYLAWIQEAAKPYY